MKTYEVGGGGGEERKHMRWGGEGKRETDYPETGLALLPESLSEECLAGKIFIYIWSCL